jgi:transposase
VASYLGLVPGENTTGFSRKRTRLTRAGATPSALGVGPAGLVARHPAQDGSMAQWAKRVAERRGADVGSMALARKLSHVLYAMWKHETIHDPRRAAQPVAA